MAGQTQDWQKLITAAEQEKNDEMAESLFEQAILQVQADCGNYHINVAHCIVKFAMFLEVRGRAEDALLRYKLAAAIFKRANQTGGHSLAESKILHLELTLQGSSPDEVEPL